MEKAGWAQLSTENVQRPDQSNCLRGFTKIDAAKWVAPTKPSLCIRSSCYLNVVSNWNTNEAETN